MNPQEILNRITYKDWQFHLEERGEGYVLQVRFVAPDTVTGKIELQHCRKWYISKFACANEIVRTAYQAVIQAERHEIDENFKLDGENIFNPHRDYLQVAELMKENKLKEDFRK